jgi:acetylornithine deacetylase
MHVFELTRKLIDIESITDNEKPVALFLSDYLGGLGYTVSLHEAAPGRFNVQALAGGNPDVVFTSHIDTVPPFIPFSEDEEYIYGRGACDAKGIVAAMIQAAENLRTEGENRVGLLFVVGEERNSAGALYANLHPVGSRYFIDGEPTENKLAVGSKGSLRIEITASGRAAHSAYPQMGESAILKLLDILQDVRTMELPSDPEMGDTTFNIGVIEGGTKPNIIPDRARTEVMFRYVEPLDDLKQRLESLIGGRASFRYPFEVPVVRMNVVEGLETTVVSFSSDVPFLTSWGRPLLLGPGSILDAHTAHERISKSALLEGITLYTHLSRTLLSGTDLNKAK